MYICLPLPINLKFWRLILAVEWVEVIVRYPKCESGLRQTNLLHAGKWGAFNHASRAPRLLVMQHMYICTRSGLTLHNSLALVYMYIQANWQLRVSVQI